MGDPSYPLVVSGRKVWADVDSMVVLMLEGSLSVREGSRVVVDVVLSCWDIDVEDRISPLALMSVVGEIGAGVLNSKARYELGA